MSEESKPEPNYKAQYEILARFMRSLNAGRTLTVLESPGVTYIIDLERKDCGFMFVTDTEKFEGAHE